MLFLVSSHNAPVLHILLHVQQQHAWLVIVQTFQWGISMELFVYRLNSPLDRKDMCTYTHQPVWCNQLHFYMEQTCNSDPHSSLQSSQVHNYTCSQPTDPVQKMFIYWIQYKSCTLSLKKNSLQQFVTYSAVSSILARIGIAVINIFSACFSCPSCHTLTGKAIDHILKQSTRTSTVYGCVN